jgi:hypothetical protein
MYIDTISIGNGTQSYAVKITVESYEVLVANTTLQGVLAYINTSCGIQAQLKPARRSKNTWQVKHPVTGYVYIIRKVN